MSDRLISWAGMSGVESLVEAVGSLSRRDIDCEGVVGEGVRKRWTKGFVEGSVDVSPMMSVRRFEDSYALAEARPCMSSRLKWDARGSMLDMSTIRPWFGDAERRGRSWWESM